MRAYVSVLILAIIAAIATTAAAEPLKIEPGLWEVTYTIEMQGGPPAALLAQLPADKRAAMEKAWAARAGQPKTNTTQSCVTAADVARGTVFEDESEDAQCQRTVESQTATRWTGVEHCKSDDGISDRAVEMTASNPKVISGSMHATHGTPGDTSGVNMKLNGKWLAKDCGDVD